MTRLGLPCLRPHPPMRRYYEILSWNGKGPKRSCAMLNRVELWLRSGATKRYIRHTPVTSVGAPLVLLKTKLLFFGWLCRCLNTHRLLIGLINLSTVATTTFNLRPETGENCASRWELWCVCIVQSKFEGILHLVFCPVNISIPKKSTVPLNSSSVAACEGWPTFPPLPTQPVWEGMKKHCCTFHGFFSDSVLMNVCFSFNVMLSVTSSYQNSFDCQPEMLWEMHVSLNVSSWFRFDR